MVLFYKQFLRSRTVFCLIFSVFCLPILFQPQNTQAANDIFTIKNVKVDVTAEDALKARDQAFEKAQIKAFKTLASRILSDKEAKEMHPPVTMVISNLIQDYEVTKEKLSAVRYIGTYTFRFKESDTKRYFTGRGQSYTDVSSNPVLALPFWQGNKGALLWSPYNVWLGAWNRAGDLTGLVPIIVPLGDLSDVRDISDGEALHYERRKLRHILRRYKASEAVILIASPDQAFAGIQTDNATAIGSLFIKIYRTDRSEPELVQRLEITARGTETRATFLNRAVKEVHRALQKDWKQKTIVDTRQTSHLNVRVHVRDLKQWAEMQRALKAVNGIEKVSLQSLSPKFARVELVYSGNMDRLNLALKQAGMTLESAIETPQNNNGLSRYSMDRFLSGGYSNNRNSNVIYDLYLDRHRAPGLMNSRSGAAPTTAPSYDYHSKPRSKNTHQARYPGRYVPATTDKNGNFQANF